jgi:hypothetical protein
MNNKMVQLAQSTGYTLPQTLENIIDGTEKAVATAAGAVSNAAGNVGKWANNELTIWSSALNNVIQGNGFDKVTVDPNAPAQLETNITNAINGVTNQPQVNITPKQNIDLMSIGVIGSVGFLAFLFARKKGWI